MYPRKPRSRRSGRQSGRGPCRQPSVRPSVRRSGGEAAARSAPGAVVGPVGSSVIVQQSAGSRSRDAVGPFDQADPRRPSSRRRPGLRTPRARQPVGVEMVDRQAAFVFVDQDERRAGDRRGIDPERLGDRADQPGLARAERADQADDRPRLDDVRDGPAQARGLLFRVELDRSGRGRRFGTDVHGGLLIGSRRRKMVEAPAARSALDRPSGWPERQARALGDRRRRDRATPAQGARPGAGRRPRARRSGRARSPRRR